MFSLLLGLRGMAAGSPAQLWLAMRPVRLPLGDTGQALGRNGSLSGLAPVVEHGEQGLLVRMLSAGVGDSALRLVGLAKMLRAATVLLLAGPCAAYGSSLLWQSSRALTSRLKGSGKQQCVSNCSHGCRK